MGKLFFVTKIFSLKMKLSPTKLILIINIIYASIKDIFSYNSVDRITLDNDHYNKYLRNSIDMKNLKLLISNSYEITIIFPKPIDKEIMEVIFKIFVQETISIRNINKLQNTSNLRKVADSIMILRLSEQNILNIKNNLIY